MKRESRIDRREFLERMAIGAGVGAVLIVSACDGDGGGDGDDTGGGGDTGGGDDTPVSDPDALAWDADAVALDAATFSLGVQAGAVRATTALLWGFTEDGAAKRLRIWRDTAIAGEVVLAVDQPQDPADGYFKVEVTDLQPDTWYRYAWFDDELTSRSVIGRFRSAFADGQIAPITIGATCCTKWTKAPYHSLVVGAQHDFDILVNVGDMSYNDLATTLEEYRVEWRKTLTDPGYLAALPRAAHYVTLDDHEIANNFDTSPPPAEQYAAALDAWFETLPVPRGEGDRIWDSYRWGDTLELFVLDSRTERQFETRQSDDPIYLSKEQMAWLKEGLSSSPCHFKVLLNSCPIIGFPEGWVNVHDRWQGYHAQREELLDHIVDQAIPNVWFLSGDLHIGLVAKVEREGPRSGMWDIMVGPGAPSLLNPVPGLIVLDPNLEEELMPPDWFLYGSSADAFTLLDFDPVANTVHVRFLAEDGETTLWEGTLSQSWPD